MFGNNPVRKQVLDDTNELVVQSVFYTIQGEGPFAGQPAVFVRLWGCNLRCTFCDTDFESNAERMSNWSIVERIKCHPQTALVVITGGEPMRQNIVPLVLLLERSGYTVQIETAGTLWVPGLEYTSAVLVVSPKTATLNANVQSFAHHYKYVVKAGHQDEVGLPTLNPQTGARFAIASPADPAATIYLAPMDEQDESRNAANLKACVKSCLEHGHSISIQQHKIMGVD